MRIPITVQGFNTLSARAGWHLDCIKYQKRGAIVTTPWQVCERGRAERSARSLKGRQAVLSKLRRSNDRINPA
jgi:hypothetical protein